MFCFASYPYNHLRWRQWPLLASSWYQTNDIWTSLGISYHEICYLIDCRHTLWYIKAKGLSATHVGPPPQEEEASKPVKLAGWMDHHLFLSIKRLCLSSCAPIVTTNESEPTPCFDIWRRTYGEPEQRGEEAAREDHQEAHTQHEAAVTPKVYMAFC